MPSRIIEQRQENRQTIARSNVDICTPYVSISNGIHGIAVDIESAGGQRRLRKDLIVPAETERSSQSSKYLASMQVLTPQRSGKAQAIQLKLFWGANDIKFLRQRKLSAQSQRESDRTQSKIKNWKREPVPATLTSSRQGFHACWYAFMRIVSWNACAPCAVNSPDRVLEILEH